MSQWIPHITVASVIERDGQYLMVEERDKTTGKLVFNQPAGHLEEGETLVAAARRETLEETGWIIEITAIVGIALYTAPGNGVTYYRTTFLGTPLKAVANAVLEPDIHAVHWLDYEAILTNSAKMRSPLVLAAIEQQRRGIRYPLDLIYSA